MSPSDHRESRTIRVDNTIYEQLTELAAYWSVLKGEPQSISELANTIISLYYDEWNPMFIKIISDPKKAQYAKQLAQDRKRQLQEILSGVSVKE